jgi:hypothetical protein
MILHHTRGGRRVEILAVLPTPTIYGETIVALVEARGGDGTFVATYDDEGHYGGLKDGQNFLDLAPFPDGAAAGSLIEKLKASFAA